MSKETFTYSELQRFLGCPRKYLYSYEWRYNPVYDGVPRPVGAALHHGVDLVQSQGVDRPTAVQEAADRFKQEIPQDIYEGMDKKEQQQVDGGLVQVKTMVEGYPWGQVGKVVASELTYSVVMEGGGEEYEGRLDLLLEHNDDYWVHDTKTTGYELSKMAAVLRMRMQFAGYFILADAWLRNNGLDHTKLSGVMSDIIGKPRVYWRKDGSYSHKEATYHREPMHMSLRQVDEFSDWFHDIVGRIQDNRRSGCWIKNTDSCMAFNRLCPYFNVCRMGMDRAERMLEVDSKFAKRDTKHRELDDAGGKSGDAGADARGEATETPDRGTPDVADGSG